MYVFGSGVLIGTDQYGYSNNFGLVQEVTLNIATTTKALYGQNNFPVAVGSGTRKMTAKAKLAKISGQTIGRLFFGVTPSPGTTQTQFGETWTVPTTPYQVTTTYSATWTGDEGVTYAASGLPLKKISTIPSATATTGATGNGTTVTYTFASLTAAPTPGATATVAGMTPAGYNGTFTVLSSTTGSVTVANTTIAAVTVEGTIVTALQTGQYSVAAGVYTFASGDASTSVLISYTYTAATTGESVAVTSSLIGPSIVFSANLFAQDPVTGKQFSLYLYNCVAETLSFGTKLEDFVMPEFDFQCFANAAGQVCQLNFGDAA